MVNYKVVLCKQCNQLFNALEGQTLCPHCSSHLDRIFHKVKKYIRHNPAAGMIEVSEACDVSTKQIIRWVREERLYFSEESDVGVPCLNCGVSINTGKYCSTCKRKMSQMLTSVYVNKSSDTNNEKGDLLVQKNKMHTSRFLK